MSCWSLTAVKSRDSGKTRLAGGLTPAERGRLVDTMLGHVLSALGKAPDVDRVAVVSPDGPSDYGLPEEVVRFTDPGGGLNRALAHAAQRAAGRGATRLVIVHADLPRVQPEEITALIEGAKASGLAVAPDHHGTGTNALCLPLPLPFELAFGPGSLARHLERGKAAGLEPAVIRLPGLAFDLDELEDLESNEDTERLEHLEPAALLPAAQEATVAGHGL
ncbi:MAG: 2-phospho-L-lactate guanylyltransferase, partial [Steroidobacteraceae bacterium]